MERPEFGKGRQDHVMEDNGPTSEENLRSLQQQGRNLEIFQISELSVEAAGRGSGGGRIRFLCVF